MKYQLLLITALCLLLHLPCHASDGRESAAWWLKNYGGVSAKDEPLVGRAEAIFDKVLAAADKNGTRFPRLVVINYAADPYAASIQDGSIILTVGGLKLCYLKVDQEKGDSRLAFLLGHELAHQAKDDYWHAMAFAAVKEFSDGNAQERRRLLDHLRGLAGQGNQGGGVEAIRTRELQADSYGLLYMAMAGYDPMAVVAPDGSNFFRDWVSQIAGGASFQGPGYPGSAERTEFFRAQLASVAKEFDLFLFGVRLYHVGNYQDAILLLDRFREKFPAREVFGNIGLAYFQLAMKEFSACDPSTPVRFKLPTVIDASTLALGLTTRDLSGVCQGSESYRRKIVNALNNLLMAASKDPRYRPTQINLASLYILIGEYSKAIAAADAALAIAPNDPYAINCKAVSLYLYGQANNLETADTALAQLREAAAQHPEVADSLYNQGTIAYERERDVAAKVAWQAFLAKEPTGPYARAVRRQLDLDGSVSPQAKEVSEPSPPFPLGEIRGATAQRLKNSVKRSYSIGRTAIEVYEAPGTRVLAINNNVEIVEVPAAVPVRVADFLGSYGEPQRRVLSTAGRVLVYHKVAVEERGGMISTMVFFR